MTILKSASALAVGATLLLGAVGSSFAADLPVKAAVPKATPWVLDVHGYADLTFASSRVTNGGLYLYNRGFVYQIDTGLSLDIYKNASGFINSFSIFGGVWNEFWSDPIAPNPVRVWQEMDMYAGFSVGFAQYWTFTAQHVQFHFPGTATVQLPTAYNYDFKLSFNDAFLGLPVVFNPYIDVFYNASGGSTVVLGKTSGGTRVSIGMVPTVAWQKYIGVPLTVSMPTWVTVGDKSFWNREDGTTNRCGSTSTSPCATNSVGYYSTGLQAKLAIADTIVPKRLGSWYVKAGVQYYHLQNDALVAAQFATTGTTFPNSKRDIVVGSGGIGFSF
jgi:hypothetical protein